MSTERTSAVQQSWQVSSNNIKLYVVGVGHFVDHGELHSLAHDFKYVFSATDSHALNKLLIETAHPDCNGMYVNKHCWSNLFVFKFKLLIKPICIWIVFYIMCFDSFICISTLM